MDNLSPSTVGAEKPVPWPGQALVHGQHQSSGRTKHLFSLTWVALGALGGLPLLLQ